MLESVAGNPHKLGMKPGLIFLLKLAWESRIRLPLLIVSGFMALGLRIQMEINIDRRSRFFPRLRLDDDEFALTDGEDMDSEEDDTDENDENDEDTSWMRDSNYDTEDYDSYDEEFYEDVPTTNNSSPSNQCPQSSVSAALGSYFHS